MGFGFVFLITNTILPLPNKKKCNRKKNAAKYKERRERGTILDYSNLAN